MVPEQLSQPILRPGVRIFRCDDTHLQVGVVDDRIVLPATAGVRGLMRALELGGGVGSLTPDAGLAFGRLVEAGLVVERAHLVAATRSGRPAVATAAFATYGPDAPVRLAGRASCRVGVDAPEPWSRLAADCVASAGLASLAPDERPTLTLLVWPGEPPRSRVDRLVRDDLAHLVLTLLPDRARLGPFVVPGATACLRCVDAHLAESDPRRGLVLEQLEDQPHTMPPYDQQLADAGLALAVRELASYAEGDRPATWSGTLSIGADLDLPLQSWSRHPHCGCSWG